MLKAWMFDEYLLYEDVQEGIDDNNNVAGDATLTRLKKQTICEPEGTGEMSQPAEVSHFKLMADKLKKAEHVGEPVRVDLAPSINELVMVGMGDEMF
jgi:hypothetical protein